MRKFRSYTVLFCITCLLFPSVTSKYYNYQFGNFIDIFQNFKETEYVNIDAVDTPEGSQNIGGAFLLDQTGFGCDDATFEGEHNVSITVSYFCWGGRGDLSITVMPPCTLSEHKLCGTNNASVERGWYRSAFNMDCATTEVSASKDIYIYIYIQQTLDSNPVIIIFNTFSDGLFAKLFVIILIFIRSLATNEVLHWSSTIEESVKTIRLYTMIAFNIID